MIYVPPHLAPFFTCHLCDASFTRDQGGQFQRHVVGCVREHEAEIEAARPSVQARGGPFDRDLWDPEYEDWVQNVVGRRMLREGRLERKPGEH